MADMLPGYTWDGTSSRYRSRVTGRYVARRDVVSLLESQVAAGENALSELTTAMHEGRIDASVFAEQMRTQLRRMHLQNSALGAGGWDQLTQRDYGRVGGKLNAEYRYLEQFARELQAGDVSLPQALTRVRGYVGAARTQFYAAERERAVSSGPDMTTIERRRLDPGAQHCKQCPEHYERGWQTLGSLPLPSEDCQCGNHCRCSMDRREVPTADLLDWIGTKR